MIRGMRPQEAACVKPCRLGEDCDVKQNQGLLPRMLVSPARGASATNGRSTCGLVAMTSASHAEGRQFDPGQVYELSYVTRRAQSTAGIASSLFAGIWVCLLGLRFVCVLSVVHAAWFFLSFAK